MYKQFIFLTFISMVIGGIYGMNNVQEMKTHDLIEVILEIRAGENKVVQELLRLSKKRANRDLLHSIYNTRKVENEIIAFLSREKDEIATDQNRIKRKREDTFLLEVNAAGHKKLNALIKKNKRVQI